ncbi:CopG family transcriptional regulator [Rhizobacter sp. P5_C2]
MRATLSIDDDILATAKQLAKRDRKTVGAVISALARQGLAQAAPAARVERNGVPLLPSHRGAATVTPELVNQLRDERP